MHKETITYTDYDGNERTEDFRFNLTEAEIAEWELVTPGGLSGLVEELTQSKDGERIVAIFKKLVLDAYGKKSPDGRRFIKSEELKKDFMETPAYSIMFMKLAFDANAAAEFINNVIPKQSSLDLSVLES